MKAFDNGKPRSRLYIGNEGAYKLTIAYRMSFKTRPDKPVKTGKLASSCFRHGVSAAAASCLTGMSGRQARSELSLILLLSFICFLSTQSGLLSSQAEAFNAPLMKLQVFFNRLSSALLTVPS